MVISSPESSLDSVRSLRRVPRLSVRDSIDDIIPDIRRCTLRELQMFGRGFNPGTSSVNISAFNEGTLTYKDVLINNLSAEGYEQFLTQLALIFGCSFEELKNIGVFCYNVSRGFNKREDVPPVSFQMGIASDGYAQAIGNQDGNSWIYLGE